MDILGLDFAALDRIRTSRDARFDGRVFIAVTSTRIYCRPICPSRTSKSCNVRFYATAAAAAQDGFRPCLRCRPEAAPGTAAWLGTSAVVQRALKLIDGGALDERSVDALAEQLGIGPRHLHRLFLRHVGASPSTVAQQRRLDFAKRLLDDTRLPITEIALAAGFRSVRRFNAAFQRVYRKPPSELRRQRSPAAREEVTLRLAYRPPYDWTQVARDLGIPGAREYTRGPLRVRPLANENALELQVRNVPARELLQLITQVRRVFDLAADPQLIAQALRADPLLADFPIGLRLVGKWGEETDADALPRGISPVRAESWRPWRAYAGLHLRKTAGSESGE